jgi:DNA-binding LytR/AlgR family response regulator
VSTPRTTTREIVAGDLGIRGFVRLSRGILANTRMIARFSPMPGGTLLAIMTNGQELSMSRSQARILRGTLMRL